MECTVILLVAVLSGAHVVSTCPACECEDSTDRPGSLIINCNNGNLTQVPVFNADPYPYYAITLRGNYIHTLTDDAFAGINVEKIDLTNNRITRVEDNAFRGQEGNVKQLILHTNRMTTFPTASVNRLTNLEILTLNGFDIQSLPSRPFRQLSKLRELSITECNLRRMESDALADQANTLTVLHLNQNLLDEVPTSALAQTNVLQTLGLYENNINRLVADSFSGLSLVALDLHQNAINSLSVSAFAPLASSLETLNLRSTKMVDSRMGGLKVLVNLKKFILDYNDIIDIPTDMMDNMNKLEHFSAQENGINRITDQMFQGAGNSLRHLNLERNHIGGGGSVDKAFNSLHVLEELFLNGQNIAPLLTVDSFRQLDNTLKELALIDTSFSTSDLAKVNYLKSLQTLRLSSNSISSIPDMNFQQMINLENIYMDNNNLLTLNQKSLFGTHNSLKAMKFASNGITTLGHCTLFMFNVNIYDISLSNNPLNCDCHLKWLKDQYDHERNPSLDFLIDWKCNAPSNLAGRLFREVDVSEFLCSPMPQFPPCQDLTPTTTTTTTTTIPPTVPTPSPGPGTTVKPEPLELNITDVTDTSLIVAWTVAGVPNLNGFLIEYLEFGSGSIPEEQYESKHARQSLVQGLLPDTDYLVCVEMLLRQNTVWDLPKKSCENIKTKEQGLAVVPLPNVGIIIGAVVGGIILILLIILLIVFLVRRHRKTKAEGQPSAVSRDVPFSFGVNGTPRLGSASKRFSKPKSENLQNYKNEGLSLSSEGFSEEERNKIFDMLRNNRGSTLSMESAGSNNRYVPEPTVRNSRPPSLPPRPQDLEGYLNPVMLRESSPSVNPSEPHKRRKKRGAQPYISGDPQSHYQGGAQPHYQGGAQPYLQDIPPPQGDNQGGYQDTHLYSEIPADVAYEEIPAGYIQTDSFV